MADIFDEVSEDLRKDQYKQIWQKYKKVIITFFTILIISLLTFKYVEYYNLQKQIKISNLYLQGLQEIRDKKYKEAENTFKKIISESHDGYVLLSYFKLADISFKNKDTLSMESYYDKIIKLQNINSVYKDFALILKVSNTSNLNGKQKIELLKPFISSPNQFQPIASELEILYLLEEKQSNKAKEKLNKLLKQKNILNTQKNRLNAINEIYFN